MHGLLFTLSDLGFRHRKHCVPELDPYRVPPGLTILQSCYVLDRSDCPETHGKRKRLIQIRANESHSVSDTQPHVEFLLFILAT